MAIKNYMESDHKQCDDIFAEFENSVVRKNMADAQSLFQKLKTAYETHFSREEDILFPEFDEQTGMNCGPTTIMRKEHEQMRFYLATIENALAEEDRTKILGLCETFNLLAQQHNSKEEQVLYVMCDTVLAAKTDTILERMHDVARIS